MRRSDQRGGGGNRLNSGDSEGRASSRTSPRWGASPSRHTKASRGSSSNDAANALWAATARMPDQRLSHARVADWRRIAGTARALALASCKTKRSASSLQRPPISMASTTNLHRRASRNSGYVRCLRETARRSATPSWSWAPGIARPLRRTGETRVASRATWAPWKSGSPVAMTSIWRSSLEATPSRFKSRTNNYRLFSIQI